MIGIDPGALVSVVTLAGSAAAGLAARYGLARLDRRHDRRKQAARRAVLRRVPVEARR